MNEDETLFLAQVALRLFEVRPDGSIWRLARWHGGGAPSLHPITPTRAERSLSRKGGYMRVMFRAQGSRRRVAAHRIVWMYANRRPIPHGLEINHKDGNKQNNDPDNLETVTHQQNAEHYHKYVKPKKKAQPGEANARHVVTAEQVREIRSLWAARSMTQREIGERYGIKQTTVNNIVNRHSWKHLP